MEAKKIKVLNIACKVYVYIFTNLSFLHRLFYFAILISFSISNNIIIIVFCKTSIQINISSDLHSLPLIIIDRRSIIFIAVLCHNATAIVVLSVLYLAPLRSIGVSLHFRCVLNLSNN